VEELAVGEAVAGGRVDKGGGGVRELRVAAEEEGEGGCGDGGVGGRETERGLEAVESSGFPVETTSWICDGRPYAFSLLHVKEASALVKVFLVNLYY